MAIAFIYYFNSKMVRLEDGAVYLSEKAKENFNSKMVRLEVINANSYLPTLKISIPKWYD